MKGLNLDGLVRFQSQALMALQEAAEAYLVMLFQDKDLLALHTKRAALMSKDLAGAKKSRREQEGGGP